MNLFKRKKEPKIEYVLTSTTEIPKKCEHIWKDFSPYIIYKYNPLFSNYKRTEYGELKIKIIEPYVCCKCYEREDIELYSLYFDHIKESDAIKKFEQIKQENDFLKPRPIVEDEIADMRHQIDRDFLRMLAVYRPATVGSGISNDLPILEKFLNKGE